MVGLVDISAVGMLLLVILVITREAVFRWRVKLRVITRDESLLEEKRLKIINIAQGPDGTSEVNALRMIPLDELESEGHVVGD
ncbi:MAG: hypothetical protein ACPGJA_02690 [Candidatus Thalassarchaeaceae archaeon]